MRHTAVHLPVSSGYPHVQACLSHPFLYFVFFLFDHERGIDMRTCGGESGSPSPSLPLSSRLSSPPCSIRVRAFFDHSSTT